MQTTNETMEVMKKFKDALIQLRAVDGDRYKEIKAGEWFKNDGSINDKLFKDIDEEEVIKKKKTMCKYLLYLFAGALAKDVHIATGNVLHKGLNEKIKDMGDDKFYELLGKLADKDDKKTKLMNETGAYKYTNKDEHLGKIITIGILPAETETDEYTPSHRFNKAVKDVAGCMKKWIKGEVENEDFCSQFIGCFNTCREELSLKLVLLRNCWKRPGINIARCFKRFFGKQDFSFVSSKYKKVFEPLNLEDASKYKYIAK